MGILSEVMQIKEQQDAKRNADLNGIINAPSALMQGMNQGMEMQKNRATVDFLNQQLASARQKSFIQNLFTNSFLADPVASITPISGRVQAPQPKAQGDGVMSLISGGVGDAAGNPVNDIVSPTDKNAATTDTLNSLPSQNGGIGAVNSRIKKLFGPNFQLDPQKLMDGEIGVTRDNENDLRMQERQDQFNQRQYSTLVNKINPSTASSRSTLGMAANGNMRANRALATIDNNPTMTYQDLGNVVADLAGIYQGGAPTDMGMKHQQYESIQSKLANMTQFATGKPQDAVSPEIKKKLRDTITSLKDVNNAGIKNALDGVEAAQKKLLSNFPDEWSQFRKSVEEDYMQNVTGDNSSSGNTGKESSGNLQSLKSKYGLK